MDGALGQLDVLQSRTGVAGSKVSNPPDQASSRPSDTALGYGRGVPSSYPRTVSARRPQVLLGRAGECELLDRLLANVRPPSLPASLWLSSPFDLLRFVHPGGGHATPRMRRGPGWSSPEPGRLAHINVAGR
jgi:hypothetical protein